MSVGSSGAQGRGDSFSEGPSGISADGRFVAISSEAPNLVPHDNNAVVDVFIHDRLTGGTTRVSIASNGEEGNGRSIGGALSGDGRLIAFQSEATNLVAGDRNGAFDVFVHDLRNGQTTRVSVASTGAEAKGDSYDPTISADGRFVAFGADATNLVPGYANRGGIYVHNLTTGETSVVSVNSRGAPAAGDGGSHDPSLSADGRFVAFDSFAPNLVPKDTNREQDVFVHDRLIAKTTRVSISSSERQGNQSSVGPRISADGRFVAFASAATNLVRGDTNRAFDIFVRDLRTQRTTRVSVSSRGRQGNGDSGRASISSDGRLVAFQSYASNLVPGDRNATKGTLVGDIFVRDRLARKTIMVSVSTEGRQGNIDSGDPAISADGAFVAFVSWASTLVPDDTNRATDVFVRGPLSWRHAG